MPVKIFFCYAHEDEMLLNKLKTHLSPLRRMGLINLWYDRNISAGTDWEREIDSHLNTSNIILLLVSPDFIDSDYCYGIEMQKALEMQKEGKAHVIPIILRHILWQKTLLGRLQALPTDGKPVTDPDWYNLDKAFFIVAEGIAKLIEELTKATIKIPKQAIEPIEKPDSQKANSLRRLRIFLTYSSVNRSEVRMLYQRLKAYNVDPWLDQENLLPGQDWEDEIRKAIRDADVVIFCLSSAVMNRTGYLHKEIRLALDIALVEKPEGITYLIPLKLEPCNVPERLMPFQFINFFEEDGFEKLVEALEHRRKSLM